MHKAKAPLNLEYADVCQDARRWAQQRYDEGYRGAWLAQRVWGDMKDEYGRSWRKYYDEQKVRDRSALNPPAPQSYEDPDQSVVLDVHAALDLLPDLQRRIVIECDMNGRRQDIVATELSITITRLKTELTRARESLRLSLRSYA